MRIIPLQQGTLEWLDWRRAGLGGSDLAALLGLSPYEDATREALFAEKVHGTRKETNFAMRRGTRLEPVARAAFERLTGRHYEPVCVEHDDEPWMRCSLDGLCEDVPEGFGNPVTWDILEIKAGSWQTHDLILSGLVPDHFGVQCQWQLLVTGADVCHLVSINDGRRFARAQQIAHVEVRADGERQAELLDAGRAFWAEVEAAREGLVAA